MGDPACSVASLEANESLAGTAVESVDRWLLLEVTDAWPSRDGWRYHAVVCN
jgi:hypothetical protein